MAATPKLSGVYTFSLTDSCQVTLSTFTDQSTGDVGALKTIDDGKISESVSTVKFNAGTMSISGVEGKGSILLVPGLSNANEAMAQSGMNESLPFSNTMLSAPASS